MQNIHSKIKSIRLAKNLKQEDIAIKLGMSKANYSRIEKGDITLSPEKLEILQSVFNMTSEEILNHETAQERLGLPNHGALEEIVKQQAAQIERMKSNSENLLEALIKHFQKPITSSKLDSGNDIPNAIASVFAIDGIDFILNKDNIGEDHPLLAAYKQYKISLLGYGIGLFLDALIKETSKGLQKKDKE
ncbi:helix-turn-helix domain-containing protein [Pontibacter pudoricolor]|uniref:helix-turn-helix domain-containing protein n=1 Tax=Pontibacter pudoricolor TaxID=2694930 RepID=UPI0013911D75|nr:helix-turn-helix transcriptional regulator [Pontibacter pudoricolor]